MKLLNRKKLITHDGAIHADDLFACATLILLMEKRDKGYKIIRTRDKDIIGTGDFVFDVGGIYDPGKNRFDHHQSGGAGARHNGISYASFGLVWKHFGMELCREEQGAWKIIDDRIASPIDAFDNGIDFSSPIFNDLPPFSGSEVFLIHSPTWKERDRNNDEVFVEQTHKVADFLRREIKVALDDVEGTKIIMSSYEKAQDKRIIELDTDFPRYLYQNVLSSLSEPVYVVYPSAHGKNWKVEAISKNYKETMESRKPFPKAWSGFLNHGPNDPGSPNIQDLVFSHAGRFLMVLSNRNAALEIAQKALES